MKEFADQIKKNLESNGFPNKKVSLPTEKMYEIADNKGHSLNSVLDFLKSEEQIEYEIGPDKIVFSKLITQSAEEDFLNNPEMMKKAQEMMANMDPEQLKAIQDQIMGMSDTEREDLMNRAKDMGLY